MSQNAYDPKCFSEDHVFDAPGVLGWLTRRRKAAVVGFVRAALCDGRNNAVLDIGCGYGEMLSDLPAERQVGIDINHFALGEARRRNPQGCFAMANVERLPLADSSFDAVICSEVLEHMDDPLPLAREIVRVTRPGGVYCITVPNERVTTLGRLVLGKRPAKSPAHKQAFTPRSVARLFPDAPAMTCVVPYRFLPFVMSTNVVALFRKHELRKDMIL